MFVIQGFPLTSIYLSYICIHCKLLSCSTVPVPLSRPQIWSSAILNLTCVPKAQNNACLLVVRHLLYISIQIKLKLNRKVINRVSDFYSLVCSLFPKAIFRLLFYSNKRALHNRANWQLSGARKRIRWG